MFKNRMDAGTQLAQVLTSHINEEIIVLAVVRGGVPVGVEVARAFDAPLDICLVKKIGAPYNQELAVGAVSLHTYQLNVPDESHEMHAYVDAEAARLQQLLRERARRYRGKRAPLEVRGTCVVLVDDGIATGRTVQVAVADLLKQKPKKLIIASPVIAADTVTQLAAEVDTVVSVLTPTHMYAIGEFYEDFHQLSDADVVKELSSYWRAYDDVHNTSEKN